MDIADAVAFLRTNHRSVLHTYRADGAPQLSPVVHGVDEEGRVVISTREPAMKVRNLRRRPEATVLALNDGFFGQWAQVDGTVEIVELPEAMELLKSVYRAVAGEHADWADFERAMVDERRVALRLTVERAGPSHSG